MNIIFGDALETVPERYTVLELDTLRIPPDNTTRTAYCIVENLPLADFSRIEALQKVHADLISNYRLREWNYCEKAIEGLQGCWNGELKTFYDSLLTRVLHYKESPPPEDWDGSVIKN